ncbi:unnamed protein product [Caenorhabditis angaria]|uniref:DNA polymerase alpha subunit B n=1 Tax=Caenorhabditis angaria TaxID=860376 RepID=A0A9P1N3N2_9PELO|nr:unnamed protein product [Caenorhabditis angaria]
MTLAYCIFPSRHFSINTCAFNQTFRFGRVFALTQQTRSTAQPPKSSVLKKNMSYEFDLEYMNECMEPFALSCPDDDNYIGKFEEICRTYHQTVDNIVDEIVSIMQNHKSKMVNLQVIESLEKKLEAKMLKESATPKAKKFARKPLADKTPKIIEDVVDKMEDMDVTQKPSGIGNSSKLVGKYSEFSPFPNSPANENFAKRNDPGKVINTIRGSKFIEDQLPETTKQSKIEQISKSPQLYYGGEKASLVIDAKIARFEKFAENFRNEYGDEISEWGNPKIPSAENVCTYGQVVHDDSSDNEKFSEFSACLMLDDEDGSIIRVDFSKIQDDVTLFPGQIIAVSGTNETGEILVVDRIFAAPKIPISRVGNDVKLSIWLAAGPFTSSENCAYEQLCELLDQVGTEQPDVLILTGPFVDRKNNFLAGSDFNSTYDLLLEDLFVKIEEKIKGTRTQLIIQPSPNRDLSSLPVFPTSPFVFLNKRKFSKNIHFVADPSMIRISDCFEVAITSSDVIVHLSKLEYHRSSDQENHDRIARLSGHLLSQRSMYPLEPAQLPSSMEDVINVCELQKSPHLFITPCILAPFAKSVDKSAFLNPSTLAKGGSGTFIKFATNFSPSAAKSDDFSVLDYSLVEICKI